MSLPLFSVSTSGTAPRPSFDPTTRGVLAMLVGMGFQVANDTVVKLAAARLPASEIMAARGVMAISLALVLVLAFGMRDRLKLIANPMVALRSVLEAGACLAYMTALAHLGLAEFNSIVQATPLIITALAGMLGWQKVGWRRWAAIAIGFVGVLLIAKPSAEGVNTYAALALLSAFITAVRDLVTRRLPPAAPSLVATLGATIAVTIVGLALGASDPGSWVAPTGVEFAYIAIAAALVVMCNLTIVLAFRSGDMSVIGPFRYSIILSSLAIGWAVWGDRPDALALVGSALIVASGLYALRREKAPAGIAAKSAPLV